MRSETDARKHRLLPCPRHSTRTLDVTTPETTMARTALVLLTVATVALPAWAQFPRGFDDSASNLMVVLRESEGSNKQVESLVRTGKGKVKLPDGRVVEMDSAWFEYLGDMHVRFVFDTPTFMPNATYEDLERLGLTPEAALE